jgi:hypothetical protein
VKDNHSGKKALSEGKQQNEEPSRRSDYTSSSAPNNLDTFSGMMGALAVNENDQYGEYKSLAHLPYSTGECAEGRSSKVHPDTSQEHDAKLASMRRVLIHKTHSALESSYSALCPTTSAAPAKIFREKPPS